MKIKRLSLLLSFSVVASLSVTNISHADTATATDGTTSITSTIQCTCDSCEKTYAEVKAIKESLDSYVPSVTIVHSINNTIPKCYYKPELSEIPNLEQKILSEYKFVNAYTGEFDLNNTEEYKPEDTQSRALEVLGYDFLLTKESYKDKVYSVEKVDNIVTQSTVIMDIYKALGIQQFDISVFQEADDTITMENSPAVKGLPSYVSGIDTSRGKTSVFTTRTNPELYRAKAVKDLNISQKSNSTVMSYSEFMVLLAKMMHFYGEPVMSETEMNQLLQVYGADIPTYLTSAEAEAYLYLKARGVWNVELDSAKDYTDNLDLDTMLDVLMCVKDDASRTNYKEIQVTVDVGDELVNQGFFPKNVYLSSGADAFEVDDVTYDYSNSKYYDYYIKIDKNTKFKDSKGDVIKYPFVPSIPNRSDSPIFAGSEYVGKETIDKVNYYHFRIPIINEASEYMTLSKSVFGKKDYIQIDTTDKNDTPTSLWLRQGGGIYTLDSINSKDGSIVLKRKAFDEDTFEGSVCYERKNKTEMTQTLLSTLYVGVMNILSNLNIINIAEAASSSVYTNIVEFTVYNVSNATYKSDIIGLVIKEDGNKWNVKVPVVYKSVFLASIKRNSTVDKTAYPSIANMSGNVLLNYNDLVEAGVFFNDDGDNPEPESYNDQILVLESSYGQVVLNNESREIVVGNNIYRLKNDSSPMFKYVIKDDKSILWVDFRAAYGWSANIINTVITGTGSSYTINVELRDSSNKVGNLNLAFVAPPASFTTYSSTETVQIIPKKVIDDNGPKVLMTSDYALANWVIFQGVNRSTGLQQDYAFIFYPKSAFKDYKLKAPNDIQKMTDILGYSVSIDNWACRVVALSRNPTAKSGLFTYTEDFGYVYNLPKWTDFSMLKYLKGEVCLLPLSYSGDKVINANVNYFSGYPYGSRPTNNGKTGVDIKGNATTGSVSASVTEMSAAPAGVAAFYGGIRRQYYEAGSSVLGIKQAGITNANVYYYGTTKCEVAGDSNNKTLLKLSFTNTYPWVKSWYVKDTQKFYKVKVSTTGTSGNTTKSYRWVMYDDVLSTSESELKDAESSNLIDIVDGELKDKFTGNTAFTIQYLLNAIDTGTSYVILFTLEVVPYIAIICLTLLLGISFMSDNKIVKFIVSKTIDPVKILTGGTMVLEELHAKDSFLGLIFGYMGFALIMDGNILRITSWVLEYYTILMEMIRQL